MITTKGPAMTDTLARPHRTASSLDTSITWASPGDGLWVASRLDEDGAVFLGWSEDVDPDDFRG